MNAQAWHTVLQVVGYIVYAVCVLYSIGWGLLLRRKAKSERATEKIFEVHGLLQAISLILIPALSLSPLHLLWMLPASYLMGPLSMFTPLKLLLWPLASLYGSLWYIGLHPERE